MQYYECIIKVLSKVFIKMLNKGILWYKEIQTYFQLPKMIYIYKQFRNNNFMNSNVNSKFILFVDVMSMNFRAVV